MFAYCNNNPVNAYDPSGFVGRNYYDHFSGMMQPDSYAGWVGSQLGGATSDWITGTGYTGKETGTVVIGVSYSAFCGAGVTGSAGIAFDTRGNIGLVFGGTGGGGFPSAGLAGFISVTNAPQIDNLKGLAGTVGGSISVLGASLGGEYQVFNDSNTSRTYHGGTLLMGGKLTFPPVEFHGGASAADVVHLINVRELWKRAVS